MITAPWLQFASLLILAGIFSLLGFLALPKLIQLLLERFASSQIAIAYAQIVEPSLSSVQIIFGLAIADIILLLIKPILNLSFLEITLSLSIAIATFFLGYQLINRCFRFYIEENINKGRKLDAEILLGSTVMLNLALGFIVIAIFAETHEINIFSLLASIGIGREISMGTCRNKKL